MFREELLFMLRVTGILSIHHVYKVLRDIVNAPWYIRNTDLHRDLNVEMVTAVIRRFARKHEARLHHHVNVEAIQLLDNSALCAGSNAPNPLN